MSSSFRVGLREVDNFSLLVAAIVTISVNS